MSSHPLLAELSRCSIRQEEGWKVESGVDLREERTLTWMTMWMTGDKAQRT